MAEINARKQIIDKIGSAENILITVSSSPSVDELAAALALTIAINKSGKRATAVASGEMPDALKFLRPEKTFENSVDSLRDFIIALSKDKADHLRYKLVGDYVKIFITPYKTTITDSDLEFEQGDFNVDLVVALGVQNKDSLDSALAAHGRILHDATVGVITVGESKSELSSLNWHIQSASSLSEVVLDVISNLGKDALTKPVATALLTGIVAETERFSNDKTSAKVMNIASKLMTAGADQQLVATKLAEASAKIEEDPKDEDFNQSSTEIMPKQPVSKPAKKTNDGSLSISHDDETSEDDELDNSEDTNEVNDDILSEEEQEINQDVAEETPEVQQQPYQEEANAEDNLEESLNDLTNSPVSSDDVLEDLASQTEQLEQGNNSITSQPEYVEPQAQFVEQQEQPSLEIIPPIENYAPELPQESAPLNSESAFISENPIETQNFEPAQQQTPQISTHDLAPHFDEPQQLNPEQYEGDNQSSEDTYIRPATSTEIKEEPSMGGTLNATTDQAADDARRAFEDEHNKTILTHGAVGTPAATTEQRVEEPQVSQMVDNYQAQQSGPVNYDPTQIPPVDFGGFPPPPPIPDFSQMTMPPELPSVPEFDASSFVAPTVENTNGVALGSDASTANVMQDAVYPSDPSQFKIPGM